jgi:hypothetical protein
LPEQQLKWMRPLPTVVMFTVILLVKPQVSISHNGCDPGSAWHYGQRPTPLPAGPNGAVISDDLGPQPKDGYRVEAVGARLGALQRSIGPRLGRPR